MDECQPLDDGDGDFDEGSSGAVARLGDMRVAVKTLPPGYSVQVRRCRLTLSNPW